MFSIFNRLFRSQASQAPQAPTGIQLRPRDCHTHVIPGVDDGSRSFEESLDMLRLLRDAGARRVIATPHIFPARYPNEPEALAVVFNQLCQRVEAAELDIELDLGAEHFLDDELAGRIRAGAILAFGPERYVLFETHTGDGIPAQLYDVIRELRKGGYTPLLGHVERYRWLRDEDGMETCEDLRSAGVRFQVNRTVGQVNRPGHGDRGRFIARLLEAGWIDEVGSHLHRPTPERRPYKMNQAQSATSVAAAPT